MQIEIRQILLFSQEKWFDGGQRHDRPLRKAAAALVIANPYAGRQVQDLRPMIDASRSLGVVMAEQIAKLMPLADVQSYGKGGVVGLHGEQEHANAMLTTEFFNPIRDLLGGAAAWVSSMTKIGSPGTTIDVPMNCRHDVYVRSHYDGMTLTLTDAPQADEIALILCFADGPRLNARVGGLSYQAALPPGA